MNEIGSGRIEAVEFESLEQRELLRGDRSLAPRTGLAYRVLFVIVSQRRFDMRRPARHVVGGEHAAMTHAATVHDVLRTAETVDCFGNKAVTPGTARALDLRDAVAAGAFGFFDD